MFSIYVFGAAWDNGYAFDLVLIDQTDTPPWLPFEGEL